MIYTNNSAPCATDWGTARHTRVIEVDDAKQYKRGPSRYGEVSPAGSVFCVLVRTYQTVPKLSRIVGPTMCPIERTNSVEPMISPVPNMVHQPEPILYYMLLQEGNVIYLWFTTSRGSEVK